MKSAIGLLVVLVLVTGQGCGQSQQKTDKVRYVAIGDSYSIGEGAKPDESWPAVLTRDLRAKGINIDLIANPSRSGWTSQQATERELPVMSTAAPNFATLQIGVNDWVHGVNEEDFRKRFVFLVERMLEVVGKRHRLLVVTIPDFGVTPTGARYANGRDIAAGITAYNKIMVEEAKRRGLPVVDVFPLSKKMGEDASLIANDGLHPSAKEYAEWEKIIAPTALESLKSERTSQTNH